ncbi:hypothetical protein BAE44_0014914, partial [Dichanthelium oligosanthes]
LGEVVFSGWSSDRICGLVEEVECLAAFTGIRKELSSFTEPIWLKSYCLAMVQMLNDYTPNRSPNCIIIKEAKRMLRLFRGFKISKCNRSANTVAHSLGQIGRRELSSGLSLKMSRPACRQF